MWYVFWNAVIQKKFGLNKKTKTIEKKIDVASEKIIDLKTINGIGPKLEEILKQTKTLPSSDKIPIFTL